MLPFLAVLPKKGALHRSACGPSCCHCGRTFPASSTVSTSGQGLRAAQPNARSSSGASTPPSDCPVRARRSRRQVLAAVSFWRQSARSEHGTRLETRPSSGQVSSQFRCKSVIGAGSSLSMPGGRCDSHGVRRMRCACCGTCGRDAGNGVDDSRFVDFPKFVLWLPPRRVRGWSRYARVHQV